VTQITDQYFSAFDSSPGTQVWKTSTGAFVPTSDAGFQAWLQNPFLADILPTGGIVTTANDGTGKIKVQCASTANMRNGQEIYYQGVPSGFTGLSTITVNDATHFTVDTSTFTVPDTNASKIYAATWIATIAQVYQQVDDYNQRIVPPPLVTVSSAVNYVLANTPPTLLVITFTTASKNLILPVSNVPTSIAMGREFWVFNNGSQNFNIELQDTTPIFSNVRAGEFVILQLDDNSTQNGTFAARRLPAYPLSGLYGGFSTAFSPATPTAGNIPVGNGTTWSSVTVTGDITINGSGVTALGNIPNDTPMAGDLLATAIAAPATPAAGKGRIYVDSTSKNIAVKDDAGVVKHGVQTKTAAAHKFFTAISDAGAVTDTQPDFTDLTGTATAAQLNGMSNISNTLGADVNLNNTANYFDGPSIAQGTSGTWLVMGWVCLTDSSTAAVFAAKISDGTNDYGLIVTNIPAATFQTSATLCAIVTNPAGNLRIRARDPSSTNGKIVATNGESRIMAIRIG